MARSRPLNTRRFTRSEHDFREMTGKLDHRKNIIAEGDSWFSYPSEWFFGTNNIVDHISKIKQFNLLQLSKSGDEVVSMLCGESKFRLLKLIKRYHIDYLLFSGGGNDIVGRFDFEFFLKNGKNASTFSECIHQERFKRRLNQIENAYRDLIDFCDDYSKNQDIRIFTHCYDYVVPNEKGASFFGGLFDIDDERSWMFPYLTEKEIKKAFHQEIAKHMIDSLSDIFQKLSSERPDRFSFIDTRGILSADDWENEIHPTSDGFEKIAKAMFKKMEKEWQ